MSKINKNDPVMTADESDNISIESSSLSLTLTESTPLINPSSSTHTISKPNQVIDQGFFDHTTVKKEFKWLLQNSLPIIGTYILQNSFQLASIFTLGHLVRKPFANPKATNSNVFIGLS